MRKPLFLLGWLGVLVLAACQPAAKTPDPGSATPVPTAGPVTTEEEQPSPLETTASTGEINQLLASSCTVVTQRDQPTAESPFPAITGADWSFGPAGAAVTFLEYSDFQ